MAKIKAGKKTSLIDVMAENEDLSVQTRVNQPLVGDPTIIADGHGPELAEGITALLVMAGCQARWSCNFWLVTNKHGKRGHVSAAGDFDEWRAALNVMAGGAFGADVT